MYTAKVLVQQEQLVRGPGGREELGVAEDILTLESVSRGSRRVSLFLLRLLTCSTTSEKCSGHLIPSF